MEISRNQLIRALTRIKPSLALVSVRPLSGRAFRLVVRGPEQASKRLILLSHSAADRKRNPHIARDEFRLLQTLQPAGLALAQPLHLALDHAPPFFITTYIAGSPRFAAGVGPAFCQRLAAALSGIHAVDLAQHDLSFLPQQADRLAEYLDAAEPANQRIRNAMRRAAHTVKPNAAALLHGDYWLGNLLWQDDELCGIIDWEDAMLGDPLADLGKSRLEMLWALGAAAMNDYTEAYLDLSPGLDASALPFWDL